MTQTIRITGQKVPVLLFVSTDCTTQCSPKCVLRYLTLFSSEETVSSVTGTPCLEIQEIGGRNLKILDG